MQVSHSVLEQYFLYRISAHSRSVSRFGPSAADTQRELEKAMHRVWEIVSGIQNTRVNE
jgi:hypothetical protein